MASTWQPLPGLRTRVVDVNGAELRPAPSVPARRARPYGCRYLAYHASAKYLRRRREHHRDTYLMVPTAISGNQARSAT